MGAWADARCRKYTSEKRRDWRARGGSRTCLNINDDNKPYIRCGRYEYRRLFAANKPTDSEQRAMRPLPAAGPVAALNIVPMLGMHARAPIPPALQAGVLNDNCAYQPLVLQSKPA